LIDAGEFFAVGLELFVYRLAVAARQRPAQWRVDSIMRQTELEYTAVLAPSRLRAIGPVVELADEIDCVLLGQSPARFAGVEKRTHRREQLV
jgi:hypothetical protein